MKTQIIALAAHDDLISVRDRMSWAKAPRILLVWPAREQVALKALDLRILQQHARELGAQMGMVARGAGIRRDACGFGIPVFRSTIEAQRLPWPALRRPGGRRPEPMRRRLARIRALQSRAQPAQAGWASGQVARMLSFVLAVLAVFAIASLFVPRATITLSPQTRDQGLTFTLEVRTAEGALLTQGGLPARLATTQVSGTHTLPVLTRSAMATGKASGVAQFQNLSTAPLLVPAGTVVYSALPDVVRFVTLQDAQLDMAANNVVQVPIEALEAGQQGNVPAAAIEAAEGSLSASVSVTNPEPTAGGVSDEQNVPSEADRNQLKADLEQSLRAKAQAAIEATLQEGDILLPQTLERKTIKREVYDPPAGHAGSVLSLSLEETYQVHYVAVADLRALSGVALDAELPPGYVAKENTLRVQVNQISETADHGFQVQLDVRRALNRRIDLAAASQLVRGASRSRAGPLLAEAFPLAAAPEIRLTPAWWPWLPLIPFRIEVIAS